MLALISQVKCEVCVFVLYLRSARAVTVALQASMGRKEYGSTYRTPNSRPTSPLITCPAEIPKTRHAGLACDSIPPYLSVASY